MSNGKNGYKNISEEAKSTITAVEALKLAKSLISKQAHPKERAFLLNITVEMMEYIAWKAKQVNSSKSAVMRQAIERHMKADNAGFHKSQLEIEELIADIFNLSAVTAQKLH